MRSKKNKGSFLIFIVVTMMLVSACTKSETGYQDLLQSPRLTKENEAIRSALKTVLPEEYQMVSAKNDSGEAIKYADIDGDGRKEVVFFYSSGPYSPYVECVVLKKNNGTWKRIIQKTCNGYDINAIEFGDMNGDKKEEMAVLWSDRYAEEQEDYNAMELFVFKGNSMESIFTKKCSKIALEDINQDNSKELFIFKFDNKNLKSSMSSYTMGNNMKIHQYYQDIPLQESAYFYNFVYGNAGYGKNALFLDGGIGAHSGITEIIMDKHGRLERLPILPSNEYGDIRVKPYYTNSKDFDGDGIIEVSQLKPFPGYEKNSMVETEWMTEWFKWDGGSGLVFAGTTYENYDGGYSLRLPEKWRGLITLRTLSKKEQSGSIELDSLDKTNKLCRIYIINGKDDYLGKVTKLKESEPTAVEIAKHLNKTVFAVIPKGSSYKGIRITPALLRNNLSFSIY